MLPVRKFHKWREAWKLASLARKTLADPFASVHATMHAKSILTALAERRPICRHCYRPYEVKTRSFAEMFQVRSILMIPDKEPDPMLCEECFSSVVTAYNPKATNVGTSNSGHSNMVLKELG